MPASASDYFQYVGEPGTATTLSAPGYTAGGTSINVGSTTNFPTATGVTFSIDEVETVDGEEVRVAGTYNVYRGTVASGTSIDNLTWVTGDGDRNYAAGSGTRVYITTSVGWADNLVDGLLVAHDQDGTLKAGAVDNSAVIADGVITPAKRTGGFKVGTIPGATFGSTGNKSITGVGFTPKLVKFTVVPTLSNTTNITGIGAMDNTGAQYTVLGFITSTAAARRGFTASCIGFMDTSTTTGMAAAYVSMDADGFTINVTTANSTFDIAYEAYA